MFNSRSLLSSKGPLGAIWIAAYFFKKLKKAQVKETDISSSVDKILEDEINVVTYRVLAYLLLGIVRIFSKKVEYLFNDCNDALIEVKKFVISAANNAPMENLHMSSAITLPDRFELDEFDLGILEDIEGSNTAPKDQITLKDVLWKNEGTELFWLDKYQPDVFDSCQDTCSNDHPTAEDVQHSHRMDFDFEDRPHSPINLQEGEGKFQDRMFSQEEPMDLDIDSVVAQVLTGFVNLTNEGYQINEEQMKVPEAAPSEDEMQGERSLEKIQFCRVTQEEYVDISMFCGREEEAVVSVEPVNKSHSEEHMDHDKFSVAEEKLEEVLEGPAEEHHKAGKSKFKEKVSTEDGKSRGAQPESIDVDLTPEFTIADASGSRTKPGATMPGFMLLPTPDGKEAPVFRKKRCVLDRWTILPNDFLRSSILNSTDLVSRRRKIPPTLSAASRASRISALPEGFHDPLLPYHSHELCSLFSKEKMKKSEYFEILETPGKLDEAPSQTVARSEHVTSEYFEILESPGKVDAAPSRSSVDSENETSEHFEISETAGKLNAAPSQIGVRSEHTTSEHFEILETAGKLDAAPSQTVGGSEHVTSAPKTPSPLSAARTFESSDSMQISDLGNLSTLGPKEGIQRDESLNRDEALNLMKECNSRTSSSHEFIGREHSLAGDEELNEMNEEVNSSETENPSLSGWSGRTRKAARYLHKSFMDQRKQGEEEVVNFSKVMEQLTKKESARLFHELLVLKSTNCVDVKQDNAYGDISVRKLPKFEQTFEDDDLEDHTERFLRFRLQI